MVGVYGAEGDEAVAHDGEEGDEDVVNDVNYVELFTADVDPACLVSLVMDNGARGCLPIRKRTQARPKRVIRVA